MNRLLDPQNGEVCSVVIDDNPGSWGVLGSTAASVFVNGELITLAGESAKPKTKTGWCKRVVPRGNDRPAYMTGVLSTETLVRLYARDKEQFFNHLAADVFWLDIKNEEFPQYDVSRFLDDLVTAFPGSCFYVVSRYVDKDGMCTSSDPDICSIYNRDLFFCPNAKSGSACKLSWNDRHVLSKNDKMDGNSTRRIGDRPDREEFLADQMCEILHSAEVMASFDPGCVHVLPLALPDRNMKTLVVQETERVWEYLQHTWAEKYASVVPGKYDPWPESSVAFARNGRFLKLQPAFTGEFVKLARHLLAEGASSAVTSPFHGWTALRLSLANRDIGIEEAGLKKNQWKASYRAELYPLTTIVPPCGRRATECVESRGDKVVFKSDFPEIVLHIPPASSAYQSTDEASLMSLAID